MLVSRILSGKQRQPHSPLTIILHHIVMQHTIEEKSILELFLSYIKYTINMYEWMMNELWKQKWHLDLIYSSFYMPEMGLKEGGNYEVYSNTRIKNKLYMTDTK